MAAMVVVQREWLKVVPARTLQQLVIGGGRSLVPMAAGARATRWVWQTC